MTQTDLFSPPQKSVAGRVQSLELVRFGKFQNRRFDLKETNLFYGPNEAGKSTLFDAIFYASVQPSRASKQGKRIADRYGLELDVRWPGEKQSEDEFLGLHALRDGQIRLNPNGKQSWLESLESRVFSEGVDLNQLIGRLEQQASEKRVYKHNKELVQLEKQLSEVHAKHQELTVLQNKLEEGSRILDRQSNEADRLEKAVAELRIEEKDLQQSLAALAQTRRQHRLVSERQELAELEVILEEVNQVSAASKRELERFDQLDETVREHEADLKVFEARRKDLSERLGQLEEQQLAIESELQDLVRRLGEAEGFRVEESVQSLSTFTRARWSKERSFLFGAVGLAVGASFLGAALFLEWLPFEYYTLIAPIMGAMLGVLGLGREAYSLVDPGSVEAFVRELGVKDSEACPLSVPHEPIGPEELQGRWSSEWAGYVATLGHQMAEVRRRRKESRRDVQAVQSDRREIESRSEQLMRDRRAAVESRSLLLVEARVADRDEWIRRLNERQHLLQRRDRFLERHPDWIEREARSARRIEIDRELESGSEATDEFDEATYAEREGRLKEVQAKLAQQGETLGHHHRQLSRLEGEISGKSQGLARRIFELEEKSRQLSGEIESRRESRRAAAEASRIFQQMKLGARNKLVSLAQDVRELMRSGMGADWDLELDALSPQGLRLRDAAGELREVTALSAGTRDLFVLGVRLALARRFGQSFPLLILDDPFLSLDEQRMEVGLRMVRFFQDQMNWQLVVLTKDDRLLAQMSELWGNRLNLIELERAVPNPDRIG